jgi:hypothetical protein
MGKFIHQGPLSDSEREILKKFIEEEILDDKTMKELDDIYKLLLNGSDASMEKLTEILNNKMFESEESFAEHLFLMELYIFVGASGDPNPDHDELEILTTYLSVASKAAEHINYTFTNVENFGDLNHIYVLNPKFGKSSDPSSYDMEMVLVINDVPEKISSSYIIGSNAGNQVLNDKIEKYGDELENYNLTFGVGVVKDYVIDRLSSSKNPKVRAVGEFAALGDYVYTYKKEKNELLENMTILEAANAGTLLNMELIITETASGTLEFTLHPTEVSMDILKRWEEAHNINPNLPYPKEHIEAQDWGEIAMFLLDHDADFRDDFNGVGDYIQSSRLGDYESLEEMLK